MTAIRLEHAGGAAPTTITALISDSDLTILLADATGWPTGGVGPFVCTINAGEDDEEKIKVTSRSSTTLTVATRGYDSTTAIGHSAGATITHTFSATEADEANEAAVAVAAATGGLVGRTQSQTLTGKTVALGSNTVSGTLAQFNTAVSDADLASLAGSETLTNKTLTSPVLTTPTIASLTNAQHNHSNAAGGGAIPQASVTSLVTDLAALDTRLDILPFAMAAGVVDVTVTAAISGTATVTYPTDRFSVAPIIQVTVMDTDASNYFTGVTANADTGCTVKVVNYNEFSTSLTVRVHWVAVQMASGSASG